MAEAAGKDGAFCAEAADSVLHAVNRNRYSEERGLYADTPEKCWFSQHSNIWAVLAGAADHERSNRILDAVLIDKTLSPCTLYFSFYLLEVLCENGRFEAFLDQLIGSSFQLAPIISNGHPYFIWTFTPRLFRTGKTAFPKSGTQ